MCSATLESVCLAIFLNIIITGHVTEFIFILGNKEQQLFLVVSQSDVHIDFDLMCPFFVCAQSSLQIKFHAQLSTRTTGRIKVNLPSSKVINFFDVRFS